MADRSNTADNVVVTGTYENDNLSNTGTMVTIQGLGGNDTISNSDANNVTISGDDGNDYIYDNPSRSYYDPLLNVSITGGAGNDYIESRARNSTIDSGDGHDTVSTAGNEVYVSGGTGNDSINTSGTDVTVYGGDGTDEIICHGSNSFVDSGSDNDVIYSDDINRSYYGDARYINVTLNGGAGNDYIYAFRNNYGSLNGGAGDDVIRVRGGDNVSINGGAGNDSVNLENTDYSNPSAVIAFSGEGLDTITGFGTNDTLKIAGSYATQVSDNDVIVLSGAGSIRLIEASNLTTLNIQTVPAGSFGDTTSTPTTSGGLTTGTSQVISNYTGEPVTVSGFTGATFSGNNFVVNSSAGTLTIQNVVDKIVDLRNAAGGEFLKAYQASSAGVVDGRGISAYEIIYGSAAGMDVIFAGDGGSQLWGGSGNSADAIAGGNGFDIFIGGKYQGADVFYNASSADAVNLTDATLSDIVAAVEVNGNIAIGFNTGNIITIQSTELLSAAVNLADGSSWRFNHVTKSWQGA